MKKYICILLALAAAFCAASCSKGGNGETADTAKKAETSAVDTEKEEPKGVYDDLIKDYTDFTAAIKADYDTFTSTGNFGTAEEEFMKWENSLNMPNCDENVTPRLYTMLDECSDWYFNGASPVFSYEESDINGDGVKELVFKGSDGTVFAVYTQSGDKAILLDAFSSKHEGVLYCGKIIVRDTTGALSEKISVCSIADGAIGVEEIFSADNGVYTHIYDAANNLFDELSEYDYTELCRGYSDLFAK